MFIQAPATTEDAEIIVLEWAERWLDDDTKVAGTVTVSVPFANLDLPKNFRPRKKKMYSISEDAIYLRVGQSFYCSNEAKARARELRYAPAETMIKYILGWITLADLGMIARGADKKEVEGLRRENKGLRKSLDEARKQARKFLDEKTALEDELRSTTFSLKVMLGQNEDTLDILKKHWDILGDIRRVAGETEKVPFWQKGRSHDKLELIRGRLERAAAEDKI
ncbi:hypothetical protein A2303_06830 [Candidatus Falkowbacteria bacterium RIFOXYB2_FULL_47_14]|uniref:Uncharacterized protein n=1 Tax=Candidatus Falkowbacteria bacterium RIFOXYA2_FULL_47_19 TaxID=1797994 RepID=A0A1F5SG39_9BACT|nr:MAG: hypothetical protein A2227_00575 [Candidatus Falkowbacteria bacterium RIFOXYA2_FULL_47_19]OGF35506.1 MAG: hypothetical protein A2468_05695 [Candidatus Falkowbacteria bacterium RIFOXYC2_FULL_46_15]OGF43584.1 MAG: hypothetical protein A2303_06830 [Candidatus Falkowbacteria bacterium RIFOXYB2_FULL_47_14]